MHHSPIRVLPRQATRIRGLGLLTVTTLVAVCFPAAAQAAGTAPPHPPAPGFTVVADHLANPRGLSFSLESDSRSPESESRSDDSGAVLYVAEAGLGGGTASTGVQVGTGQTGSVVAVSGADSAHPQATVVSSNLWSETGNGDHGFETVGPAGISAGSDNALYVVMSENYAPGLGPQPQQGRLLRLNAHGQIRSVADVATASLQWESIPANHALNPQFPDTNPYGVTTTGHEMFVVDAAANTVSEVTPNGTVRVLAYIPNTPRSDAVPTCVTQGPDGALYVGTLAIAEGPGGAKVYRIDPETTAPATQAATVWASGLSTINGCAFSPDGKYFYASEFLALETLTGPPTGPPPSALVKIPFHHPTTHDYLGLGVLHFAGGVAVDTEGSVYVSNWSNQGPGTPIGQVLRFDR